jgi:hypothetical protein
MISSSMNFTHFSRCPGRVRYCRSSKNIMRSFREGSCQCLRGTLAYTPRMYIAESAPIDKSIV